MQAFVKRMITERDDLKGKITRAEKAVSNPPFGADEKSITLLRNQLKPMKEYLAILEDRIEYCNK